VPTRGPPATARSAGACDDGRRSRLWLVLGAGCAAGAPGADTESGASSDRQVAVAAAGSAESTVDEAGVTATRCVTVRVGVVYDVRETDGAGRPGTSPGRLFAAGAYHAAMVQTGDTAPQFQATLANGDVEAFDLAEHLGDGPVVLAFFPGAFTPPCSNEMVAFQDHLDDLADTGATLLGVSADSAFTLNAFRDEYDLEFDIVSDTGRTAIEDYDLRIDVGSIGLHGVANRAVFVLDEDGTVTYTWVADEPPEEPDYAEVLDAAEAAA
jgi:peroxiredoxin